MRYRRRLLMLSLMLALPMPALAADIPIKIYRNPSCGCCDVYARYLQSNGFKVEVIDSFDATAIHRKYGVPPPLEGCHTAVIGDYVFEGLIPAEYLKRVLDEKRPIKGLSVPGMPIGAPGLPGAKKGPINVYYLDASATPRH